MNESEIEQILHKWDAMPLPKDEYAAAQLSCAKVALGLINDLIELPKEMQKDFIIILAYLARRAFLSEEEKRIIFGKNFIEGGLTEKVLAESSHTAIILAALEWVDKGRFPQAAALLMDIRKDSWAEVAAEWESQWRLCHNLDAALVRLLAYRCGGVDFEQNEMEEMEHIVHDWCPRIEELLILLAA